MHTKLCRMKADPEIKAEERRLMQEYLALVGEENYTLAGLVAYEKEHGSEKLLAAFERSKKRKYELC